MKSNSACAMPPMVAASHPFVPVVNGERISVPQLPSTFAELDELIGADGLTWVTTSTNTF